MLCCCKTKNIDENIEIDIDLIGLDELKGTYRYQMAGNCRGWRDEEWGRKEESGKGSKEVGLGFFKILTCLTCASVPTRGIA